MMIDMVTFVSLKLYVGIKEYCILGYDAISSGRSLPMFWRLWFLLGLLFDPQDEGNMFL
jgi:hypothetical protein